MADYTREQLIGALRKADAAGDTLAAKAIARRIQGLQQQTSQAAPVQENETGQLNRALLTAQQAGDKEEARRIGQQIQSNLNQQKQADYDKSSFLSKVGTAIADTIAGGVRGAGSIGSTLIRPFESAEENEKRRADIDRGMAQLLGADTDSIAYGAGKLGAEIAGTAGAGGLIGKGISAIPGAAQAVPGLIRAIQSGGFSGTNPITRVIGGATAGAASAGLIDPSVESVGLGAGLGGVLPGAAQVAGAATKSWLPALLGKTTGAGDDAIKAAFQAGQSGGTKQEAFKRAIQGDVSGNEMIAAAKSAIGNMREARNAAYRSGMMDVTGDASVLKISPVRNALKASVDENIRGGQNINELTASKLDDVKDVLNAWSKGNPNEMRTVEGMDALKRKVDSIIESVPFNEKSTRRALGNVRNSISDTINEQAPAYAKIMKDYSDASGAMNEIEKSLSLGRNSMPETSVRKLAAALRNEQRNSLVSKLDEAGGNELASMIGGRALNPTMPQGLLAPMGSVAGLIASGGASAPVLLAQSPRLVGNSANMAGQLYGKLPADQIGNFLRYLSRTSPAMAANINERNR